MILNHSWPNKNSTLGSSPFLPYNLVTLGTAAVCQVDKQWLQKPVQLYHYVKSFKCPIFLGARVQVNFDMNLELVDKLAVSYWDW